MTESFEVDTSSATQADPILSSGDEDDELFHGDVKGRYDRWPTPTTIISDGAYGTDGFPDDPSTVDGLAEWYRPHIKAWSEAASLGTTLWVWNTEIGWATIHRLIEEHGWTYRGCNIWDKGLSHIAGNVNTNTMRKFPQVTEVCVQYVREEIQLTDESQHFRDWLRDEWQRAGLSFSEADAACGVKNAASRKYFAADEQWYCPSQEMFKKLAEYANKHGEPDGRPYLELPDTGSTSRGEWDGRDEHYGKHRSSFDLQSGLTNVWDVPQLSGEERYTLDGETAHLNQKPIELMERIIRASTEVGDCVWDPFSGTGTAAVAAKRLGRVPLAAEQIEQYYTIAQERLAETTAAKTETSTEQTSVQDDWM